MHRTDSGSIRFMPLPFFVVGGCRDSEGHSDSYRYLKTVEESKQVPLLVYIWPAEDDIESSRFKEASSLPRTFSDWRIDLLCLVSTGRACGSFSCSKGRYICLYSVMYAIL